MHETQRMILSGLLLALLVGGSGGVFFVSSGHRALPAAPTGVVQGVVTAAAYGDVSTFIGKIYAGDDGPAKAALLDFPEDVTTDGNGNFYIADTYDNVIRKVDSAGTITTLAGTGSYGMVDGAAASAEFALPRGVAVDALGNVYVADTDNSRIRKIDATGTVSNLVASGLSKPEGVTVVGSTVYIADTGNNAIKKVATGGGTLETVATGLATPRKLVASSDGATLYVADYGSYRVLAVSVSSGAVSVVAGSGSAGYAEGTGDAAQFKEVAGVALAGNTLYVSDGDGFDDRIRAIDLATGATSQFAYDTSMRHINFPRGLAVAGDWVYIANAGIGTIQRYSRSNPSTDETFAGSDRFGDREGSDPLIGRPHDLALSSDRVYLYLADNNLIRRITRSSGATSYIIGDVVDDYNEGQVRSQTAPYSTQARFSTIASIVVNNAGTALYVTDRWNNRIRKVDLTMNLVSSSLVSGAGRTNTSGKERNGYQDGVACEDLRAKGETFSPRAGCAYFDNPIGLVLSPDEQYLYVADTNNQRIRRVRISDGQTSLVAGSGSAGSTDGMGQAASFRTPYGLAISSNGAFLYVADRDNHVIRKVRLSDGTVSTLAGLAGSAGYRDAIGKDVRFSYPTYLKMANDGKLYVSEVGSHRIRVVDPSTGETKTVAGSGERGFANGARGVARFNNVEGLAPDTDVSTLYAADSWNDLVRKIDIAGTIPYSDPAPTVTRVEASKIALSWDKGSGLRASVYGTNFRHGARVRFDDLDAKATYVESSTKLAVELPVSQLQAGFWYDVEVTNLDGQKARLAQALAIVERTADPLPAKSPSPVAATTEFSAYGATTFGGFELASGDIDGDGIAEIIAGTGAGFGPQVRVFDRLGSVKAQFFAYAATLRTGVRVATCDLDGDGEDEMVTVPGPGARPHVRIFSGYGTPLGSGFFALDGRFLGGANVACGDVTGDGVPEIVVAASRGGGPHVTVHRSNGSLAGNFMAYDKNFRGGIRVGVLDMNGDGVNEVVTGPETGAPHVQAFSRIGKRLSPGFYAFDSTYRGGINVAGGDIDGDGNDEIIVGSGAGIDPKVRVFSRSATRLADLLVYRTTLRAGVRVSADDVDGDGKDEVFVLPAGDGRPTVRVLDL